MSRRGFSAWVAAACGVALVLRLVLAATVVGLASPPDARFDRDQLDYEATGWGLASGHGFAIDGQPTWFRPPGTSLLIAPVYAIAGRSRAVLRVVFALLSTATCALVAVAGRRAFGSLAGVLAAWMLAIDPAHALYAMHFGSETPYGFLLAGATAGALAVWGRVRNGRAAGDFRATLVPGLLLGGAILVRPQALFVLPLALAVAGCAPRSIRAAALRVVCLTLAVSAVLPAAWMARNALRFGHFSLAAIGATTFYGANNEQVLADPALCGGWTSPRLALGAPVLPQEEALYAERASVAAAGFLSTHWRDLPRLEMCKLARVLAPAFASSSRWIEMAFAASWLLVAPFALLSLWRGWKRDPAATAIVTLPLAGLLLATLVFYGAVRFRHSTEAMLVLLAAQGVAALVQQEKTIADGPIGQVCGR